MVFCNLLLFIMIFFIIFLLFISFDINCKDLSFVSIEEKMVL